MSKIVQAVNQFLTETEEPAGKTKFKKGDKVVLTRAVDGLRKGERGTVTKVCYDGTADGENSEYEATFGKRKYNFDDGSRVVKHDRSGITEAEVARPQAWAGKVRLISVAIGAPGRVSQRMIYAVDPSVHYPDVKDLTTPISVSYPPTFRKALKAATEQGFEVVNAQDILGNRG